MTPAENTCPNCGFYTPDGSALLYCPVCQPPILDFVPPPAIVPAVGTLAVVAVVASLLLIAIALCLTGAHR